MRLLIFIFSLLFSVSANAQIGMSRSQIVNMENELESKLIKNTSNKLIYNNNNVNFFYEFSGSTCSKMSVIGQKRFDFELKKQLYKRGYRLNDDYEYQRESYIAEFIDLPNKYVQVAFSYTSKPAKKVKDITKAVDNYLGDEAVKKAFADSFRRADSIAKNEDFKLKVDSMAAFGKDSATLANTAKMDSIKRAISDSMIRKILPVLSIQSLKSSAKMKEGSFSDPVDSSKTNDNPEGPADENGNTPQKGEAIPKESDPK